MENFWKAAAIVLLTLILGLAIGKTEKDFSVLLTMMACCVVFVIAISYLEPVLDLLWQLIEIGQMKSSLLEILLKVTGIALVTELVGMICVDAGNASLGKALQFVGSTAILYLSIPLFNGLLTLIREILGEL